MVAPSIGRSLALTNDHLAVATLWLEGYTTSPELQAAADELEASGLALDGRLAPRLGELLDVMLRPMLRVHVELLTSTSIHADLLWMRPELAVTGDLDDVQMVLTPLDPIFLLPELARRVGLRRGPAAPLPDGLELPMDLLDRVEEALRSDDDPTDLFTEAGHDVARQQQALTNLVRHRRSTWRCNATWQSTEETFARSLVILDGGPAGLVEILDDADAKAIRLHPCSSTEAFTKLRNILPSERDHA